jgi:hypothetical protein
MGANCNNIFLKENAYGQLKTLIALAVSIRTNATIGLQRLLYQEFR